MVGRDIGGVVDEARTKLAAQIRLPEGYTIAWGGAFENMERANARLLLVVPITLGLVFFLLFWAFHSLRYATLIILNLPFALIGGVVSLWLSGQYLSVPASIGFIELFGLAVGNGIVLVSYINQLRRDGMPGEKAIVTGCSLRLRPVIMTMMTTLLGLLPLALAQGIGAEVQRPLATVVIGGIFSSTALTLIVLPALYHLFAESRDVFTRMGVKRGAAFMAQITTHLTFMARCHHRKWRQQSRRISVTALTPKRRCNAKGMRGSTNFPKLRRPLL